MKILIEDIGNEKIKRTFEFKNKEYSEVWYKDKNNVYRTVGGDIIYKMENDGICTEGTDIEDLLSLADRELDW